MIKVYLLLYELSYKYNIMDTDFSLVKASPSDVDDIADQIAGIAFETTGKHLDL